MKILHLLVDGPKSVAQAIMDVQAGEHQVTVMDLSKGDVSYDLIVDEIFAHDKVISW